MKLILDTTFLEEAYPYKILELIKSQYDIQEILIDSVFEQTVTTNELSEKQLMYLSYYHLIQSMAPTRTIKSQNFKFKEVIQQICETSQDQVVFFTPQEALAKNYQSIFNQKNHLVIYHHQGTLKLWQQTPKKIRAFYAPPEKYSLGVLPPEKLEVIYSPKYGYLKIDQNSLYEGGEGAVYRTYQNFLAKIYKPKHQTYQNFKKLLTMVETPIDNPHIVWPKDIIYHNHHFIGYIMENIQTNDSLDSLRDENFKGYDTLDRLDIILAFLKNVKYLHDRNILVGDMKLDNILVSSKDDVYIIDSGSFQVEDYPCVVFNLEYSEKHFTEEELKKELRTVESEYYPINRIIFEILFMRSPHSSPDNIEIGFEETRGFSYPLDIPADRSQIKDYQKNWFRLPLKIRESFYYYFKDQRITYLPELIRDFEGLINSQVNRRPA